VNADEAVGRDTAFQERPELLLNELRRRAFAILLSREKRFELFRDYTVQDRFLGLTREVLKRGALHAPGAMQTRRLLRAPVFLISYRHNSTKKSEVIAITRSRFPAI
jgi:hypothetical protein